jgi:hypothetical protein
MKTYGEWMYRSAFLDLGTSWRWVVNFTPRPLYPRGKSPWYLWIGGWVNVRAGLDDFEKRKSLTLPGLELQPVASRGRIRSIEKSSDLIGNRTRDLPACSIMPQPTTLPRAPRSSGRHLYAVAVLYCSFSSIKWSSALEIAFMKITIVYEGERKRYLRDCLWKLSRCLIASLLTLINLFLCLYKVNINTGRWQWAQLVEALRYEPEGRGFDSRWRHWIFNWPDTSSSPMALGSTLTEMNTRNLPGGKGRQARKADNFTAVCEPIAKKMWEPRNLTTLWAFTDCYRDSLTFV